MSTPLKSISTLVSSAHEGVSVIDKLDVLNYIEEVSDTLHSLSDALANQRVQDQISNMVSNPRPMTDYEKTVKDVYTVYFKALPTSVQQAERRSPLSALRIAITAGVNDLVQIKEAYPDLFGGVQSSDLKASDIKMSSVVTLGYFEALMDMASWTVYLLNISLSVADPSDVKVPPYQITALRVNAESVSRTVAEIYNRFNGETFMSAIASMRRRGNDVYIETSGHTIDQYASDHDYTTNELANTMRFLRSPMVMIGEKVLRYRQARYEKMKTMRGWLATKIGILNLQMSSLDKASPEYARMEKIISNYSNQLSGYDKEIAKYEAS